MEISIWDVLFSAGGLGRAFANLAFISAALSSIAFFFTLRTPDPERHNWKRMGNTFFLLHAGSVLSVIVTLFLMIYFHRYEYHYVWSHSSNELPVHFMISCFWEGQEGSFLLWSFWHVVLGLVVYFRGKFWKTGVLAVLASVQVMLSSMLLGVWIQPLGVQLLLSILLLVLMLALVLQSDKAAIRVKAAGSIVGLLALVSVWAGYTGIGINFSKQISLLITPDSAKDIGIYTVLWSIFLAISFYLLVVELSNWKSKSSIPGVLLTILWGLSFVLFLTPVAGWSIGSSPFLLLREAMPNAPIFSSNPDFIPTNGNGLNPLLQNYWMVIHPPTLFLGFASTLIPFAYLITGLLTGKSTEWIREATPWNLITALVLGTGILMGGYWAYETLSFGGYWNWDPVENSSLVPWLTCIGSLHAFVAWNQKKSQLRYAYLLVILTFLLVLYSTFLTRSGILGEASVHSFTDLGLSGQLLVLLGVYFTGVLLVWIRKKDSLPEAKSETRLWTKEFFLFLAATVVLFAAVEIIFFTSSPVLNKIFGLSLAPRNPLFYYLWNVWFSVAIALFSGIGQFFFWYKIEKQVLLKALYRPFALAVFSALAILLVIMQADWQFVYNETLRNELSDIETISSKMFYYISFAKYALWFLADELLLISGLFAIFANLDVMIGMIRKKSGNIKMVGGSLAHTGFALMLLGMLFSSGYDSIISVNFKPGELGSMFPEDSRNDNVLLLKNTPKYVKGYRLTYFGKKQAVAPLSDYRILDWDEFSLKVAFQDSTGDDYSAILPGEVFLKDSTSKISSIRFDLDKIQRFTEKNISIIKPEHLNSRSLYAVRFEAMEDSTRSFVLYPEAELNESMGILAHPDRKIRAHEDIYVHVSSIPDPESAKEEVQEFTVKLAKGDSAITGNALVYFETLVQVKDVPEFAQYDFVAKARLRVLKNGKEFTAEPLFIIEDRQPLSLPVFLQEAGMGFTFAGVAAEEGKIVLQIEEIKEPEDWIVLKAISKPWINLLWLGTFVLVLGFGIAAWRRMSYPGRVE